ncbi:Bcr/CflA family efflux MFS transporter [Parabacteroides sp. 52]|uniref:multidrug effflux MFS transporter n=1 Tax=unclassified Parabacteroides TaxID=2649774 RepID=UPI0013D89CDA|nr:MULTISPECIES: multidrug effflux MFS transporter [unclassified Parabacteroides]MDH6533388.1 DHA1 family bicyclomycin/chloramphenicol resistance-like MFS transporter [Parabacteroides sp. PM5-20]NDV54146.1 Bcr/CflA family efflux MFS transporter [Parabacteroides sp. 52]
MKNFTWMQWIVILILSLLTALEPLCIDMYLPGFIQIAEAFSTPMAAVQISLSTFLGGFAIGQLIWGPLADRFGRKKPILLSLFIFILASVACLFVETIEQLWVVRFIQAIGGCGGVVISRAVVTDYFDKTNTLKIFALLALIMGVAPILAPAIGNAVLNRFEWIGLFHAMVVLGVALFLLTLLGLPETYTFRQDNKHNNVWRSYWDILKVRKFLVYSLLAGLANGALMIYVANGPLLIMEYGGFSGNIFSLVIGINALGLMIGSYLTTVLQKHIPTNKLVKQALLFMGIASVILLITMYMNAGIIPILFVLFFYVFPIGILFPTTTELAITPFIHNSGTASALFGSIQLMVAFICSLISNAISDGSILTVGVAFLCCCLASFIVVFSPINSKEKYTYKTN